jgi:hypothetical protein
LPTLLPSLSPFLVDCSLFRCRHHPVHRRCRVNVTVAVTATIAVTIAVAVADADAVAVAVTVAVVVAIAVTVAIAIVIAIYIATLSLTLPSQLLPPLPSPLKIDCCVCLSAATLSLSPAFLPPPTPLFFAAAIVMTDSIFIRSSCSTCTRLSAFWRIAVNI